jgi:hypothetical protein
MPTNMVIGIGLGIINNLGAFIVIKCAKFIKFNTQDSEYIFSLTYIMIITFLNNSLSMNLINRISDGWAPR